MQIFFRPTPFKLSGAFRSWITLAMVLSAILGSSFSARATHIVGGEIGYRCLGNNTYEITLRVFRDCFYGAALAPFDDPASIGVFDQSGLLVENLLVAKIGNDTLTNIIDPCILNSGSVCVHTTTYKTTIVLTPRAGGYRFVYQRCCRNETVRNIVKPLETGATFEILLTDVAMSRCNNSPVFRSWPPIFICRDEPFTFNHAAFDSDGDSLVYKLKVPIQGGTISYPQPVPPDSPPYDTVVWNNPPGQTIYSLDNMMGFGKPLKIDPITGSMTVTPGQLGQYVIGVSVLEYDRKTKALLSETHRDFQYNVIDCKRVTAAIFAPEVQCDNRTVVFTNKSANGVNGDSYQWTFTGKGLTAGSSEKNPVFTFPDTGRYVATLIADPGTLCADTARHEIFLQNNSLEINFKTEVVDCFGSSFIRFQNNTVDSVSPIVKWEWVLRLSNGTVLTSSIQSPVFEVPLGLKGTIQLTATSRNGCIQTGEEVLETGAHPPAGYLTSTRIEACIGQQIGLNAGVASDAPYTYRWTPTAELDNPNAANPMITVLGNRRFSVTITPTNGLCDTTIQVEVIAVEQTPASFSSVLQCDGEHVLLTNTTPGGNAARWIIGNASNPLLDTIAASLNVLFPAPGTYPVTLISINDCPDTTSKTVTTTGDFLKPGFLLALQGCTATENQVQFTDASSNLFNNTNSWEWVLSNGQRSTLQNPIFAFKDGVDSVTIRLVVGTTQGCKDTLTRTVGIRFTNFPSVAPPGVALVCPDFATPLNTKGNPAYKYAWSPSTGLSASNIPNPTVRTRKDISYSVTISDPSGVCDTVVAVQVRVANFEQEVPQETILICPGVPTPLHPKGDTLYKYTWFPADGLSATNIPNPIVTTTVSRTYQVTISDPLNNCDTTVSVEVQIADFLEVGPTSNVLVCPGVATPINPKGNPRYRYQWSPALGLNADSIPNPLVTTNASQVYFVRISDPLDQCGTLLSVTVEVANFSIPIPNERMLICPGVPTLLNPGGDDAYKYSWSPAAGLSATNIANPSATLFASRTYQVRISDPLGRCDTTVTVEAKITNFAAVAPAPRLVICPGIPTPLNPQGDTLYRYRWTFVPGISATNVPNPTFTATSGASFLVTIYDPLENCDTTVVVQVEMAQFASVVPAAEQLICPGVPTALNPGGNPLYKYSWTPSTGLSASDAPNPIVTLTEPIVYQVRISDLNGFCDTVVTVRVKLVRFSEVAPDTNQTVCKDIPTPLNPRGNPAYTYSWSPASGLSATNIPNPTATISSETVYTVKITEPSGRCDTTVIVRVRIEPTVNLDAGKDTSLCSLGQFILRGSVTGSAGLEWSDRPDFGVVLGQSAALTVNLVRGAKTYYLRATTDRGCLEKDSVVLRVFPLLATLPATVQACKTGEMVDLSVVNGDPGQQLRYQWSPAELFISDPASGPAAIIKAQNQSVVQVLVTNQYGCSQTLRTTISVVDVRTKLTISADKNPIRFGEQSVITIGGCTDCNITWSPGDGLNTTRGTQVTARPEATTTYIATVEKLGCVDTISITIVVDRCVEPFLPNAFTPNGDGINDVLFVRVKDYAQVQLIIYNRWGQEVFDTRNPDIGWDGSYRGRQLPPDVYGFYLYMVCSDGTEFKKKGSISLIR